MVANAPDFAGLMDFIEVNGGGGMLDHDYFRSDPHVSADLVALIRYGLTPASPVGRWWRSGGRSGGSAHHGTRANDVDVCPRSVHPDRCPRGLSSQCRLLCVAKSAVALMNVRTGSNSALDRGGNKVCCRAHSGQAPAGPKLLRACPEWARQ